MFLGQRPQSIAFCPLESRRQNYDLNFRKSSVKNDFCYLACLFDACGLILMPSELFLIVISCKIVNSSIKFKFVNKIAVIQKKFFTLFSTF